MLSSVYTCIIIFMSWNVYHYFMHSEVLTQHWIVNIQDKRQVTSLLPATLHTATSQFSFCSAQEDNTEQPSTALYLPLASPSCLILPKNSFTTMLPADATTNVMYM